MDRIPWNHKLPKKTVREIKRRAKAAGKFEWEVVAESIGKKPYSYQISWASGTDPKKYRINK
jgi:hypothetical protein